MIVCTDGDRAQIYIHILAYIILGLTDKLVFLIERLRHPWSLHAKFLTIQQMSVYALDTMVILQLWSILDKTIGNK